MLGWFEWDEKLQQLRVVIPSWDCVDAPRQSQDVVQQRVHSATTLIKSMPLKPGHGSIFGSYFESAATWVPDDMIDLATEVMLAMTGLEFEAAVAVRMKLEAMVDGPFTNLIEAGKPCDQERKNLTSAAILMSSTTRHVYLNDLISRAREKLHEDHGASEPHASINHLLTRLESALLIAPPAEKVSGGGALIPADADRLNTHIRRLLRRLVFSMDRTRYGALTSCVDMLVKTERQSIFHHLAKEMDQFPAAVPLFAICEPLWTQMKRIEESPDRSAMPDSQTLAREVLDLAEAWITACAAMTYRFTRTYLIGLGDKLPTSPQLRRSHDLLTQHTRSAAQQRLRQRERWLSGPAPMAGALTLTADPGAQATDDPVPDWKVERLVRWINGPVTDATAAKALSSPDQLVLRDNMLLANDRKRINPATPAQKQNQKDSLALTRAQVQEIVWQGLSQSAEYLRDELRDLGALADKLGLKGAVRNDATTALKSIEVALEAMSSFKKTTTIDKAQAQLSAANSCLETLRADIKPVQVAAEKLLRFGDCLVLLLRNETLVMGKRHGGVIVCPMSMDQWGAVRDRFHRRYCSPTQVLTMDNEHTLLRSDQVLALHVTAGSQSGYAFDVSVHLWQRLEASKEEPFDTTSTELFPPMNTKGWFDTLITCAVLHVPLL